MIYWSEFQSVLNRLGPQFYPAPPTIPDVRSLLKREEIFWRLVLEEDLSRFGRVTLLWKGLYVGYNMSKIRGGLFCCLRGRRVFVGWVENQLM